MGADANSSPTFPIRLRIADRAGAPLHDRLQVCQGVRAADDRWVGGIPYRPGALVPGGDWRQADGQECARLLTTSEREPPGTTIDVAPAPAGLVEVFRELGFKEGRTLAECQAAVRGEPYLNALREGLPHLEDLLESEEGFQLLGTWVQCGDLWSTTVHTEGAQETFSGLHVDNWDKRPLGERHLARRQMSINLGTGDRFFVFVALPVDDIARTTGQVDHLYTGHPRALFSRAPGTALFRVRIRSGEMYIAPTDNLVHDGSSSGSAAPSVTLNVRGHFRVSRRDRFRPLAAAGG